MKADETDAAMKRYLEVLGQMKLRLISASHLLAAPQSLETVEFSALHLRRVLEAVALSSLLPHRGLLSKTQNQLRKLGANEARHALQKAHPNYWPKAQWLTRGEGSDVAMRPRPEANITESEWGPWFGKASDLLHERSPYEAAVDVSAAHQSMTELQDRLSCLLTTFTVSLFGRASLLMVQIDTSADGLHAPGTGEIRITPLDRVGDLPAGFS